jgi:hypothetical protein
VRIFASLLNPTSKRSDLEKAKALRLALAQEKVQFLTLPCFMSSCWKKYSATASRHLETGSISPRVRGCLEHQQLKRPPPWVAISHTRTSTPGVGIRDLYFDSWVAVL